MRKRTPATRSLPMIPCLSPLEKKIDGFSPAPVPFPGGRSRSPRALAGILRAQASFARALCADRAGEVVQAAAAGDSPRGGAARSGSCGASRPVDRRSTGRAARGMDFGSFMQGYELGAGTAHAASGRTMSRYHQLLQAARDPRQRAPFPCPGRPAGRRCALPAPEHGRAASKASSSIAAPSPDNRDQRRPHALDLARSPTRAHRRPQALLRVSAISRMDTAQHGLDRHRPGRLSSGRMTSS